MGAATWDSGARDRDGGVRDGESRTGEWTKARGRGQWRVRLFRLPCLPLVRTLFALFDDEFEVRFLHKK